MKVSLSRSAVAGGVDGGLISSIRGLESRASFSFPGHSPRGPQAAVSERVSVQGTCAALPKVARGSRCLSVVRSADGPDLVRPVTAERMRRAPGPGRPMAALSLPILSQPFHHTMASLISRLLFFRKQSHLF